MSLAALKKTTILILFLIEARFIAAIVFGEAA
jgi:hypothetical protein